MDMLTIFSSYNDISCYNFSTVRNEKWDIQKKNMNFGHFCVKKLNLSIIQATYCKMNIISSSSLAYFTFTT